MSGLLLCLLLAQLHCMLVLVLEHFGCEHSLTCSSDVALVPGQFIAQFGL